MNEMKTRAEIRAEVARIPSDDLYREFNKARIHQRYLYNHGTDDQLEEYERNRVFIEEISARYRRSMKKTIRRGMAWHE